MEEVEIQESIGELLAQGHVDIDIIATLEEEYQLSNEDACGLLRQVYDSWQHTRDMLDLNENSLQDWHVFLRKQILQKALKDSTTASLRLALSVLDSLAAVQGISTIQGATVPLQITLVEKKEEEKEPNNDSPNTESADAPDDAQRKLEGSSDRVLDRGIPGAT